MILQSISLHNFMSYADAYLDLSSINVACLSGANGAGKSALLDAVTWAIWEKGRASSDELIRLGQKEMWIDLRLQSTQLGFLHIQFQVQLFELDPLRIFARDRCDIQNCPN